MSTASTSFSVIIPTYNRAGLLTRAIDSVVRQTVQGTEIIVIDDGSTDNTREVINELNIPNLKYHFQENSERGAARNAGVRLATSDYVVFLDSDDFLYPHFISYASESVLKYNWPSFLYMGFEFINEDGGKEGRSDIVANDDLKALINGNPIGCVGVVIKREIALAFPFIETKELFSGEDWELWLRLAANHGLKTDSRICAGALLHKNRSMNQVNTDKLINSKDIILAHAFADEKVKEIFGPYKKRIEAYFNTFIALHLVLSKHKRTALKFWFKAIFLSPRVIFTKRTGAIFKRLITG